MQSLLVKGEGVPDFVLMQQLTEDALVENLRVILRCVSPGTDGLVHAGPLRQAADLCMCLRLFHCIHLLGSCTQTYIGDVVVSMNPYHQLPIYRDADVENYRGRYIYERPPHMYDS